MRYLIFNITVLSALGYLFMASPEQSFTSWIGKAPQMYDAAKTAGRDSVAGAGSSETVGTALLEAMEPVVGEVLSSSNVPTPAPAQMSAPGQAETVPVEARQPKMVKAKAAQEDVDADPDVEPVTIQDIETIIRALLEVRGGEASDQDNGAAPEREAVKAAPVEVPVEVPATAPTAATMKQAAAGGTASDSEAMLPSSPAPKALAQTPTTSSQTSPDAGLQADATPEQTQMAGRAPDPSQAASSEMSDADIAAAFAELRQSVGLQPSGTDQLPSTDLAAVTDAVASGNAAGDLADLPAADAAPAFMSPRQRADSLDLMVEELQLIYLERTGG